MIKEMCQTIRQWNMLQPGDRVLVALSGGPDSMALLHGLSSVAPSFGVTLGAVHVHHGIRPEDADLDLKVAKALCNRLGVPFYEVRADIPALAKRDKVSVELAGRTFRYDAFRRLMKEEAYTKLATAHHRDDQCETFFLRLFRGTGSHGLGGIRPVRDGWLIRPLRHCDKAVLEVYCQTHNLGARVDLTNLSLDYSRNHIRNVLIPLVQENYNPQIAKHVDALSDQLALENDYLDQVAKAWIVAHVNQADAGRSLMALQDYETLHGALKSRVVIHLFQAVSGSRQDLSRRHVAQIQELLEHSAGTRRLDLHGIAFERQYSHLTVFRVEPPTPVAPAPKSEGQEPIYSIHLAGEGPPSSQGQESPVLWDADRMPPPEVLIWRRRQPGDVFKPNPGSGTKKLKAFLIDEKIPRGQRDNLWVLAKAQVVYWIFGVAVSREYLAGPESSRILEIQPPQVL